MSEALPWLLACFRKWLPFPEKWLPPESYWVGGSLRDAYLAWLRGRAEDAEAPADLDLMCAADPVGWAAGVARRLRAGFVVLDAERQIARMVLAKLTVDVGLQAGPTPEADLEQRDFTCNALALDLQREQLLDPTGGRADIRQGRMRMVHPDNLSADPVRLLRAYRQAAQLGFALDPATEEAIRERAPLLAQVAAERVRAEVVALLATGMAGLAHLQAAVAAGLLQAWLPRLQAESPGFLQAQAVWWWAETWQRQYPRTLAELAQPLTEGAPHRSREGSSRLLAAVLAALLWDPAGTPAAVVETELERLRFSRAEMRAIQKLHHLLPQLQSLLADSPTPAQQWRLYHQAGSLFGGLALLAAATGGDPQKLESWLQRYEDPQDPLAHLVPLLDGQDLVDSLGAKPGPWVGQLLQALQEAQAWGQIQTRAEALSFARQWRGRGSQNTPEH
ncbi:MULTISPECIES: CCA tRNA nucleotidyltransferase [unclassified Synechococcus]|uniref:CCA tRNA nucleotidyltransferase n=1 Tax=unclassified Synechococcus TaxID=2626047 RepID=UPI0039C36FD1